jgi:hypothetical protein
MFKFIVKAFIVLYVIDAVAEVTIRRLEETTERINKEKTAITENL